MLPTKSQERELKNKIQKPLPKIEPLPGVVCLQKVRCGKPNCKCAKGELHGGYYYRFFYAGGKLRKQYVKKQDVLQVQEACLAFRSNRQEVRRMIAESLQEWRLLKQALKGMGL
jgi:hypothetical protein